MFIDIAHLFILSSLILPIFSLVSTDVSAVSSNFATKIVDTTDLIFNQKTIASSNKIFVIWADTNSTSGNQDIFFKKGTDNGIPLAVQLI